MMIGIITLVAITLGVSLMLPDGEEDASLEKENEIPSDDTLFDLDEAIDLIEQIDFSESLIDLSDEEIIEEEAKNPNSDSPILEISNTTDGSAENVQVDVSNAPYENDFDLTEFEMVEFSDDFNSTISGTGQSDLLVGGQASDLIDGDEGDDYIYGGQGSDTLAGGEGNDLVVSVANPFIGDQSERSELHGGNGSDTLIGEDDDLMVGGGGIDSFHVFAGGEENDKIAHISDFDSSTESLLIEVRDGQMGGELDFDTRKSEIGVEVLIDGMPIVLLEGVDQTLELNIQVRSVGY